MVFSAINEMTFLWIFLQNFYPKYTILNAEIQVKGIIPLRNNAFFSKTF